MGLSSQVHKALTNFTNLAYISVMSAFTKDYIISFEIFYSNIYILLSISSVRVVYIIRSLFDYAVFKEWCKNKFNH